MTPTWTRNHDTIHTTPECPSLTHAKRPVRWSYAEGQSVERVRNTILGAAPWLSMCRRCWPKEDK